MQENGSPSDATPFGANGELQPPSVVSPDGADEARQPTHRGMERAIVERYDAFLDDLPRRIDGASCVRYKPGIGKYVAIRFDSSTVLEPGSEDPSRAWPYQCVLGKATYACPVRCNATLSVSDADPSWPAYASGPGGAPSTPPPQTLNPPLWEQRVEGLRLAEVPCMIGSRHCRLSEEGYVAASDDLGTEGSLAADAPSVWARGSFIVFGKRRTVDSLFVRKTNWPLIRRVASARCTGGSWVGETWGGSQDGREPTQWLCTVYSLSGACAAREDATRSTFVRRLTLRLTCPHDDDPLREASMCVDTNPTGKVSVARAFASLGVVAKEDALSLVMGCGEDLAEIDGHMISALLGDEQERIGPCDRPDDGDGGGEGRDDRPPPIPPGKAARCILPHIGIDQSEETARAKARYLARCIHRTCAAALGLTPPDGRECVASASPPPANSSSAFCCVPPERGWIGSST